MVNITPYRVRFIAKRIVTKTANEGDLSEAVSLLAYFANMLEQALGDGTQHGLLS